MELNSSPQLKLSMEGFRLFGLIPDSAGVYVILEQGSLSKCKRTRNLMRIKGVPDGAMRLEPRDVGHKVGVFMLPNKENIDAFVI